MTANIRMAEITAAIAEVSIAGLTIYDIGAAPDQFDGRTAVLFPDSAGLITELTITDATTGAYNAAKDMAYKLNYLFAYKNREAGRRLGEYTAAMATLAATIIETLSTTNFTGAGAVSFNVSCPFLGQIEDPAGNVFHGGKFIFDIIEFIQG